jgi:hypothetical protein
MEVVYVTSENENDKKILILKTFVRLEKLY